MVDNKFLPKLSQNLLEILDDDEYYDITIEVGNDPYVKIFRAHMVILNYRSPYLRRTLSTNKKKNDGILTHIKLPNILPETFQAILRYIYGGRLSLEEYDVSDIIKILVAASELNLQELITYLQLFLIENKASWMEQNFNLIYQTSFKIDSFLELQKYCTDLISKEPDKIFKSLNFSLIPEKLLVSLVQNDKLRMSEVQVWEHVLKWGIAQNPDIPSDPTRYSKDDFNSLKNTLQRCIPFIKFHNLTSREFSKVVVPYKKILPKELYMDLLNDFLDNDHKITRKSKPLINKEVTEVLSKSINSISIGSESIDLKIIDSKIITFHHAELISKWIDKLKITDKLTSPKKFKLLFRGSRDGLAPKKFHKICDNQSRTVTIVKLESSSEILGGYNPIEWRSNGSFGTTNDSFIFSFENKNRIENHILSRVKDANKAVDNDSHSGPSFGIGDLLIFQMISLNVCCKKNSYEKLIRTTNDESDVEDFEVFQIV